MFGWDSRAAAFTSRWKRSTAAGFVVSFLVMTLMATGRSMSRCSALKTTPMPPAPSHSSRR